MTWLARRASRTLCGSRWQGEVVATLDEARRACRVECGPRSLARPLRMAHADLDFAFATLVVEQTPRVGWSLLYAFYKDAKSPWVHVALKLDAAVSAVPSVVDLFHGPSFDWHEREAEDLFGLHFEGHPRLGEFVLHEDWPEGVNPMRRDFDAGKRFEPRATEPKWEPPTIVAAPGAFAMPIGPVFSDFAESAHFLLETVGEDVIRTIPRFFYKYRGVEKIAEGQPADARLAARRTLFRDCRFRPWLGILPGRRGDLRDRAAAAGAGASHRVCRTRAAAPSCRGHHRHLQLHGAGGGDQPGRAHRGKPAAA